MVIVFIGLPSSLRLFDRHQLDHADCFLEKHHQIIAGIEIIQLDDTEPFIFRNATYLQLGFSVSTESNSFINAEQSTNPRPFTDNKAHIRRAKCSKIPYC